MGFEFGSNKGASPAKSALFAATVEQIESTGSVEQDAVAELDEVSAGFRDRRDKEAARFRRATDSEYWFAVCFRDRADKEAFLRAVNAARLGDKYLDGYALARLLGIDLS